MYQSVKPPVEQSTGFFYSNYRYTIIKKALLKRKVMQQHINGLSYKDMLISPIYYYQGKQVRRQTIVLPTPLSERKGVVDFNKIDNAASDSSLTVLLVGDSAAAGVGVESQEAALMGQLIKNLSSNEIIVKRYCHLQWQMAAVSGFTSFDVLRQLYVLASEKIDIIIINVGVNDVVRNTRPRDWQAHIEAIIEIAGRKFTAKYVIFVGLPPMQKMPALPSPLNQLIGKKASLLDKRLYQLILNYQNTNNQLDTQIHYLAVSFAEQDDSKNLFAKDGFHPSAITYALWGTQLADFISQAISTKS